MINHIQIIAQKKGNATFAHKFDAHPFTLARYKFVAKMLTGRNHVLEVGCADAFGTRLVVQEVNNLTATDFDPLFVRDVLLRMDKRWAFECRQHDMLASPFPGSFDAAYALDVIEHIPQLVSTCGRTYLY